MSVRVFKSGIHSIKGIIHSYTHPCIIRTHTMYLRVFMYTG